MAAETRGGSELRDDVTESLATAFFEELAAVGYGRLSLEAVAKRAGAGKAAIYRRWPSKRDMTVALLSRVAITAIAPADTGTLRGDLEHYLHDAVRALTHPLASRIMPDLMAEATRDPELAKELMDSVRGPRRENATQILRAAIDRGEIPADADLELSLDFLAGPLYWRLAVTNLPVSEDYLNRLVTQLIRLLALPGPST
ncbi:TetR-like C-terminal domain-containing protein [Amycolatopsis sp. NBC_01480]|uniref:TetR-like C-terminal domain-containing protein n=1 Tax=Amycolatopsis sp. NBC_01480 TaxID=2903562 RepID=UPI002E2CC96D|nr:TetR-like C-terminal domain-containing protein [Amycolatopsis sp. NBC_01480]